ncbi:unnamed protein product [Haemonchus placei]|uniref:Reverse transcriptase domain-containing protein n=1 Tax=Haemonchus placei TaxID=6290 RepID=A0A0N4X3D7_HAEPC|nr:unnamed protein product [Haemonchus placei]
MAAQIAKKEEKAARYADLKEKLESRDGERYVYRLAKTRNCQTEDIQKFFGINDEDGHLLTDSRQDRKTMARVLRRHLNSRICSIPQSLALRSKATGPDDLAPDLWKSKGRNPAGWLTEFNHVVAEKKVPESWQQRTSIPIWMKGSPGDYNCYGQFRPLSHSMKIFEQIVDSRIRDIVELTTNQYGFVAACRPSMPHTQLAFY